MGLQQSWWAEYTSRRPVARNLAAEIRCTILHVTDSPQASLRYIVTGDGARTAVVLPIEEYEALIEDLADLAVLAERRLEPTLTHDEVLAELRRDGLI